MGKCQPLPGSCCKCTSPGSPLLQHLGMWSQEVMFRSILQAALTHGRQHLRVSSLTGKTSTSSTSGNYPTGTHCRGAVREQGAAPDFGAGGQGPSHTTASTYRRSNVSRRSRDSRQSLGSLQSDTGTRMRMREKGKAPLSLPAQASHPTSPGPLLASVALLYGEHLWSPGHSQIAEIQEYVPWATSRAAVTSPPAHGPCPSASM